MLLRIHTTTYLDFNSRVMESRASRASCCCCAMPGKGNGNGDDKSGAATFGYS